MLREMMLPAAVDGTAAEQAGRARKIAADLADTARMIDPNWGGLVQFASDALTTRSDDQLLHDDLEPINDPVYFRQFIARAAQHKLKYLCAADPAVEPWDKLPKPVQAKLLELAPDPLQREQYLDVVLNRSYRELILCKSDAPVQTHDGRAVVQQSWIASPLKQTGPQQFQGLNRTVKVPAIATANVLQLLQSAWPQAIAFASLPMADEKIADDLLSLYTAGLIELWSRPTDFIGNSAATTPLVKLQAAGGGPVTNLRHQAIQLDAGLRQAIAESRADPILILHSLSISDTTS